MEKNGKRNKKKYNVKPTVRQKQAFQNMSEIIGNGGSIGNALVKAGYSEITAKTPKRVTETRGFRQLCNESGLTEKLVITALVEDIKNKPGDRIREIITVCRMLGLFKIDNEQRQEPVPITDADFYEIIRACKFRNKDSPNQ